MRYLNCWDNKNFWGAKSGPLTHAWAVKWGYVKQGPPVYAKKWFMSSRRRPAFNEVNVLAIISMPRRWGLRNVNMVEKIWNTGLKMRECLCVLNHFLKSLASKKTFFTVVVMYKNMCVFVETFIFLFMMMYVWWNFFKIFLLKETIRKLKVNMNYSLMKILTSLPCRKV